MVGMEGGQSSESAVFSLRMRTRSEEIEQLQLLEGSKNLKKKATSREKHMPFCRVAAGSAASPRASTDIASSYASAMIADKNLTNVLLQLLLTEITSMRGTLESLASNAALLAEIQRNNRLLALLLTSGHSLENLSFLDHPQIMKILKEKAEEAEVILKII